jgi:predicted  nucleic acid-binding Zn-ribbon protein|tara:strand:- start:1577 stop:1756 length:180 start_codon:yes stop_codon:yes gene_type:complete
MEFFKEYDTKPNKELFDMLILLKKEFDTTKDTMVKLSHHLDDVESKFKLIEDEIKKRNL